MLETPNENIARLEKQIGVLSESIASLAKQIVVLRAELRSAGLTDYQKSEREIELVNQEEAIRLFDQALGSDGKMQARPVPCLILEPWRNF